MHLPFSLSLLKLNLLLHRLAELRFPFFRSCLSTLSRFALVLIPIWVMLHRLVLGEIFSISRIILLIEAVVTIVKRWQAHAEEVWMIFKIALDFKQIVIFCFQVFKWRHIIQSDANGSRTRWAAAGKSRGRHIPTSDILGRFSWFYKGIILKMKEIRSWGLTLSSWNIQALSNELIELLIQANWF